MSSRKFYLFTYHPLCVRTSSMLRRLNYNMAIRHNRILMLWHVVVTNQLISHVIVAYCFLLRHVFCFVVFFLTCLLVPFGVCVSPISPDRRYFWRFRWFRPPSHLQMGHLVVAHHTFLCALLLCIMGILLWVRNVIDDQTYIYLHHG